MTSLTKLFKPGLWRLARLGKLAQRPRGKICNIQAHGEATQTKLNRRLHANVELNGSVGGV